MHYFSSSRCMPIFILVKQLVLLVCINSALIMSPPARTINKTPLNRHQFFSTNKQYAKIKLMQNETNRWSTFLVKTKYW